MIVLSVTVAIVRISEEVSALHCNIFPHLKQLNLYSVQVDDVTVHIILSITMGTQRG